MSFPPSDNMYVPPTSRQITFMNFFNNYIVVILVRTSVQWNNKNNQEYEAVMARHGVLQTFPVHQVVQKHNLFTRFCAKLFKNPMVRYVYGGLEDKRTTSNI